MLDEIESKTVHKDEEGDLRLAFVAVTEASCDY